MKNIHNYNPRKKASAPNQSEDKYTQRKNKFDWMIDWKGMLRMNEIKRCVHTFPKLKIVLLCMGDFLLVFYSTIDDAIPQQWALRLKRF